MYNSPHSYRDISDQRWVALAGAGFVISGILLLYFFTLRDGALWRDAQGWTRVAAQIERVAFDNFDAVAEGEAGAALLVASETGRVLATYRYTVAGEDYAATRVRLFNQTRDVSDRLLAEYRTLIAAQATGAPVGAFVDPADPSRATLIRDLDGLLFGLVFVLGVLQIGVGSLLVYRHWRYLQRRPRGFESLKP